MNEGALGGAGFTARARRAAGQRDAKRNLSIIQSCA